MYDRQWLSKVFINYVIHKSTSSVHWYDSQSTKLLFGAYSQSHVKVTGSPSLTCSYNVIGTALLLKIHVQKSIDIHAWGTEVGEPPWIKLRAFSKRQDTLLALHCNLPDTNMIVTKLHTCDLIYGWELWLYTYYSGGGGGGGNHPPKVEGYYIVMHLSLVCPTPSTCMGPCGVR